MTSDPPTWRCGRAGLRGLTTVTVLGLMGWAWGLGWERAARDSLVDVTAGEGSPGGALVGRVIGWRGLLADIVWLQAYLAWERADVALTQERLQRVTAIDERPLHFWLNGARMIAYDVPVWRRRDAGVEESSVLGRVIGRQQAERALAYLEAARRAHPREPLILIEMAGIRVTCLRDGLGAAALYREAADLPGAPYFAARVGAELLRREGRAREARAWLIAVLPTLPRETLPPEGVLAGSATDRRWRRAVEEARAEEVEARIHALSREIEATDK